MWRGFWGVRMSEISKSTWPRKPLGEIATVGSGYAFKSSEFGERGIPAIKIKNVRVGYVDLSDAACVDEKYLSLPERYHVRPGDVLISLTGSHISQPNSVVGRVARHSSDLPECLLNQRVGKILIKDGSKSDLCFLYYALSEQETVRAIAMKAHGAANQANVSPTQVESIEIPLPPLPMQRRIAGILSAYDELIENSQRRIKILESMARALYREWFVHFRFPGYESVPLVPSPLGEIPQGWEVKNVRQIAGLVSRGPSLTYVDTGGVKVVNQRCIRNDEIEMQAVQYAAPLPEKKSHLYLQLRDVLINSMGVGTLGRVSRNLSIDEPTIIHNCITVVRAKAGEPTTAFLYYRLSDCQEHFESLGVGATGQTSLRIETIENVLFALPPIELLTAFEKAALPMWTLIGSLKRQIQNLRRTRDLLLPRLLSGQINVEAMPS